eukprot:TRINITY_DN73781_c0_g1_i1.p1 TRINITY_DN73781_c0_g1~~TRINITY_DN73781_c0_g1_i1.p1  ORF type:complete len:619 (+),score=117.57 TRINITY_DN73781_c0_g1_i1:128-1858(+)
MSAAVFGSGHSEAKQTFERQAEQVKTVKAQIAAAKAELVYEQQRSRDMQRKLQFAGSELAANDPIEAEGRNVKTSSSLGASRKDFDGMHEEIRNIDMRFADESECNKLLMAELREVREESDGYREKRDAIRAKASALKAEIMDIEAARRFVHGQGSRLREAVRQKDHEVIPILLSKGADPNQDEDGEGRTPIFWAAQCGAVECIKALVAGGADVRRTSREDATAWRWRRDDALTTACQCGQAEAVRALLEAGAIEDIDAGCEYQQGDDTWLVCTPLLAACVAGKADVVRVLLEFDADLDVQRDDGSGPLHCAVRADYDAAHMEAVKALCDKGVALDLKDQDGWTPLLHAITLRCTTCVRTLLSAGASLDDALEEHPIGRDLVSAVTADDIGLVCALLESGADANVPRCEEEAKEKKQAGMVCVSPLTLAVRYRRSACVTLLLEFKADPNHRSIDWQGFGEDVYTTPMSIASENGEVEMMKQLVSYKADVNREVEPGLGYMPIHAAVEGRRINSLNFLAEQGTKFNVVAKRNGIKKGSPLLLAKGLYPDIFQELLRLTGSLAAGAADMAAEAKDEEE